MIEFHTGHYAEGFNSGKNFKKEIQILEEMTKFALDQDIIICAGHGLTYQNVYHVAHIKGISELNIGHSIISKSVFVGIYDAVKQMKELI